MQSYRDALPRASRPGSSKVASDDGHDEEPTLSEYRLAVNLLVIDIIATGCNGAGCNVRVQDVVM